MTRSSDTPGPAGQRVHGFGTAALDFRIRTADLGADYRDKLLAREELVLGGGAVAHCLVQVARLGGRAQWLGKLGTDWIGDRILADLAAEGVDCARVLRTARHCSPFNVAVYADGRRVGGYLLPNSLKALTEAEAQELAAAVAPGEWAVVEIGEIPLGVTRSFCEAVRAGGARFMVDVDLDPVAQCVGTTAEFDAVCRLADVLTPNCGAMRSIYPGLVPDELAQRMAADYGVTTVVTAGSEGAYACEPRGSVTHVPADAVDVIDTVGAGDAFHGGLLSALSRGRELSEALALATRCGAAACAAFGARSGMLRAGEAGPGDRAAWPR